MFVPPGLLACEVERLEGTFLSRPLTYPAVLFNIWWDWVQLAGARIFQSGAARSCLVGARGPRIKAALKSKS